MKSPILVGLALFLFPGLSPFSSFAQTLESTPTESQKSIPVCSSIIALRYRNEVDLPRKSDKFKHCALSCVMTLYCGPLDSFELGALKEISDALGFGTPDIEDLRADIKGIKAGLKIAPLQERERCYQACSELFP